MRDEFEFETGIRSEMEEDELLELDEEAGEETEEETDEDEEEE